ncbi:MAG: hypothetical protein NTY10_04345 [Candidatus Omnitrophica bacterium]|nr:hypothetical protein [Candidatus Omnitrophota bacterium]
MSLSDYQKRIFNSLRAKVRDETVTVVTVTKTGTGNPYGEGETVTETTVSILGKVGWNSVLEKNDTAGGYAEIGDCQVLISYTDMPKVSVENVYLRTSDAIDLMIIKIIPAEMTNEAIIICKRR